MRKTGGGSVVLISLYGHRSGAGAEGSAAALLRRAFACCVIALPALCAGQQDTASQSRLAQGSGAAETQPGAFQRFIDGLFGPREERGSATSKSRRAADGSGTPVEQHAPVPAPVLLMSPRISPATAPGDKPEAAASEAPATTTGTIESPVVAVPPARSGIALILPGKSSQFARAGEIALQGFMAARGVASVKPEVRLFETDGTAESAREAYGQALASNVSVVVGPLTKLEVGGLLKLSLAVPTLALNTPDGDVPLPVNLFALSLNTELEARAAAAAFRSDAPVAVIVTTSAPLARRAAMAFADAWGKLGGSVKESVEFAGSLGRVRQAVERARGDVVFLAADAERARMLRPYLGRNALLIGTSQVFAGSAKADMQKMHELNGMRFFDMPWLHQPDHAATMIFPRPEGQLTADLERLYALGIDAFRIAGELALARTDFVIDGVTGNLTVHAGLIGRVPLLVEYRGGAVLPLAAR